jgi:lipopolysaccharide biosynthesis glycosyltransferase
MKMDIVACTDKWFVMPTGVMMYSICVNNPDVDIVFHVIHDDSVTSMDRRDLENVVASFNGKWVEFYPVNEQIINNKYPTREDRKDITQTTYYRLWLAELLPSTIEKVLYLDGDVIVRHSLLPLWNTDLENNAIAVVPDCFDGSMEHYQRLGYPSELGYFNAGVLLINLNYWRRHKVINSFVEYIQFHKEDIRCQDQDVLNVIFKDSKVILPIKYNMNSGFLWKTSQFDVEKYKKELIEAFTDPVIVHFIAEKPWYAYQRNPHPFQSTWYKYQNQTKWKDVRYEHRPLKLQVINYVADMLRKYGLKSQTSHWYESIDIAPID